MSNKNRKMVLIGPPVCLFFSFFLFSILFCFYFFPFCFVLFFQHWYSPFLSVSNSLPAPHDEELLTDVHITNDNQHTNCDMEMLGVDESNRNCNLFRKRAYTPSISIASFCLHFCLFAYFVEIFITFLHIHCKKSNAPISNGKRFIEN